MMLQRLVQILSARLHLLEQMDVADGDHRLVGEGLQQGDLLVAKGVHLGATEHDCSDALTLTQHWYAQDGAMALGARHFPSFWKFGALGQQVVHLYGRLVDDRAARDPVAVDRPFFQTDRYWSVMLTKAQVVDRP